MPKWNNFDEFDDEPIDPRTPIHRPPRGQPPLSGYSECTNAFCSRTRSGRPKHEEFGRK